MAGDVDRELLCVDIAAVDTFLRIVPGEGGGTGGRVVRELEVFHRGGCVGAYPFGDENLGTLSGFVGGGYFNLVGALGQGQFL